MLTRKDSFPLRQSMGLDFGPSLSGHQPVQAMVKSKIAIQKKFNMHEIGIKQPRFRVKSLYTTNTSVEKDNYASVPSSNRHDDDKQEIQQMMQGSERKFYFNNQLRIPVAKTTAKPSKLDNENLDESDQNIQPFDFDMGEGEVIADDEEQIPAISEKYDSQNIRRNKMNDIGDIGKFRREAIGKQ